MTTSAFDGSGRPSSHIKRLLSLRPYSYYTFFVCPSSFIERFLSHHHTFTFPVTAIESSLAALPIIYSVIDLLLLISTPTLQQFTAYFLKYAIDLPPLGLLGRTDHLRLHDHYPRRLT
jgi:hypothetical protein